MLGMLAPVAALSAAGTPDPSWRNGLLNGAAPYYRCYRTAGDGWVAVGAIEPKFYRKLCEGTGLTRYADRQNDRAAWPGLTRALEEVFATRDREDWCTDLAAAAVTPVLGVSEAWRRAEAWTATGPASFPLVPGLLEPRQDGYSHAPGRETVEVLRDSDSPTTTSRNSPPRRDEPDRPAVLATTASRRGTLPMYPPDPDDPAVLRDVYAAFPSGVAAVCALRDGTPVGLAASSFVAVSMDPPLVSVCVQHTSTTWPLLADRHRLGLSIMSAAQGEACRRLAAKTGDRFAGLQLSTTDGGAVLVRGAAAWLECSIHTTVPAGDHDLVMLRVEAARTHDGVPPLVFHASTFHGLAALT